MKYNSRLRKNPQIFRRLTGISVEKFDEILKKLEPKYEAWKKKRVLRMKRKRKEGGGRKRNLALEDRLLMLLMYYRVYVTHAFLGFLFEIDDSNVGRNMNPLEKFLAGIFRIPEKKIEISEEELLEVFVDGTEQVIERPKRKQVRWYSGKKKKHTIKHQVVVVKRRKEKGRGKHQRKLRIAAVSRAFEGKTHDKKMYEESAMRAPPHIKGYGDSGYLGTDLIIPKKKPKGKKLTKKQKKSNRLHASKRIVVEHGIGKMKIWKIMADRYRNALNDHTLKFKNVAGLQNLMFA